MSKRKPAKSLPVAPPAKKKQLPSRPATSAPAKPLVTAAATFRWVGLLAAILGFLLYANTLGHQYNLDDFSVIKENWVVKGGLKNLGLIFSTEYRYGNWSSLGSLYRPFPLTIFALQWQLAPDQPFLGHLVNALLYAFTGWMLWITWRRVLAGYPPLLPALATLLFMAHPVHTEVVANIKSFDEIAVLLGGCGAIYGLWRYFDSGNRSWLVLALLAYTIAQFCKESAITFLAIIPLTMWFFTRRPLGEILRLSALFVVPALIFLLIRYNVLAGQEGKEQFSILDNFMAELNGMGSRLPSALMMCGRYLWTLILPHPLIHDMGYPQIKAVGFGDWRAIAGLLVYGGLFGWAVLNLPKRHFLSYAILFYLITFYLASNILPLIGTSYGERLLYAPSLGFAMGIAWLVIKIFKINDLNSVKNPNNKGGIIWTIAAIVLTLYSLKTITRNPVWYEPYTLYSADIPHAPNAAKLNYHLGIEETKKGVDEDSGVIKDMNWVQKGIASYTKAINLYPSYHDAFGSRGLAYFRLKQYDQAFKDYQEALKYRPNDAKVLSNMGFIYFMRQELDKAEETYRKSIKYDPRFVDARRNLGAVLALKKQYPAAIEQWQEAIKYEPDNPTLHQYIASAHKDMGQLDQAEVLYRQVLQKFPRLVEAHRDLGSVLAMKKQPDDAIAQWQEGLKLDPNNTTMMQFIAITYRDMGKPDLAEQWQRRAQQATQQQQR